MANSSDIIKLLDKTIELESKVSLYNLNTLDNLNFIINNLKKLNNNIAVVKFDISSLKKILSPEYKEGLSNKIENLRQTLNSISQFTEIKINQDIQNIYYDVYDSEFNILFSKLRLTNINRLDNLLNIKIETNDLTEDLYYIKFYYDSLINTYEMLILKRYKNSNNGKMQRFIFENSVNISKNLQNYKIYLYDNNMNLLNESIIINSAISNEEIDIQCFSLFEESNNINNYKYFLKEKLIDDIWIELNLGDYNISDIGNVLLGNAERNLETGTFKVFDRQGNVISEMVSVRYGKLEKRNKIS